MSAEESALPYPLPAEIFAVRRPGETWDSEEALADELVLQAELLKREEAHDVPQRLQTIKISVFLVTVLWFLVESYQSIVYDGVCDNRYSEVLPGW